MIINGPATADYDEDLGALFLSDWAHESVFPLWASTAIAGAPPSLENGLINGTNTFDCSTSSDVNCIGGGKKFETVFVSGKKYRIGLINVAIDGHFEFSIDGHNLTVVRTDTKNFLGLGNCNFSSPPINIVQIATDLVPIVPYVADSLLVSIGQRYDVIVEANAATDDYWLRAGWVSACSTNDNPNDMTGIVRYDASSTADPTTTGITVGTYCGDEPAASLVPYLSLSVGDYTDADVNEEALSFVANNAFTWTINSSSLYLNWSNPTTLRIFNDETIWPTDYNVVAIDVCSPFIYHLPAEANSSQQTDASDEWAIYVIQDESNIG